jgi:hypothetical protein
MAWDRRDSRYETEPVDPPIACDVCKDLGTVDGEPCYQCPHCSCGALLAVGDHRRCWEL